MALAVVLFSGAVCLANAAFDDAPDPADPFAAWITAALDDRSWRAEMLLAARQQRAMDESVRLFQTAQAADVQRRTYRRAPERPGIETVSQWWQTPTDHIGRPPLARRAPGATLAGVAA